VSESRGGGISDIVVIVALGTIAAVGPLVWLWGGVAGALFGGGWPRVGTGALSGVRLAFTRYLLEIGCQPPAGS
jgi:hypothetical protein